MLRLEQLEYLQAVARFNSVKLAAEALLVVPSTISTSLHKLEKETNVKILVRTHHGVELTEAAKEIATKAEEVFAALEEIDKIIEKHNEHCGVENNKNNSAIKLYMSRGHYQSSLGRFFDLFERYGLQADCPDISRGNETYLDYVNAERETILLNYFVEPTRNLLDGYPNVDYMYLNSSRPCVICSKDSPLIEADKKELSVKEVLQLPFLMFNEGYDMALPIYEWLEERGPLNIVGKYSNITVLMAMMENGKGVSVGAEKELLGTLETGAAQPKFRLIPIKCDMRISLLLCFNRKLSLEKQKILRQIAKEIS